MNDLKTSAFANCVQAANYFRKSHIFKYELLNESMKPCTVKFWIHTQIQDVRAETLMNNNNLFNRYVQLAIQHLPSLNPSEKSIKDGLVYQSYQGIALCSIFDSCRTRKASDPRDKIFALFGALQSSGHTILKDTMLRQYLTPDYSKPDSQVLTEATIACLLLDGLTVLRLLWSENKRKDLPSWVPDWSDESRPIFGVTKNDIDSRMGHINRLDLPKSGLLSLKGKSIATVNEKDINHSQQLQDEYQSAYLKIPKTDSANRDLFKALFSIRLCMAWAQQFSTSHILIDIQNAFYRNLLHLFTVSPDKLCKKHFESWIAFLKHPGITANPRVAIHDKAIRTSQNLVKLSQMVEMPELEHYFLLWQLLAQDVEVDSDFTPLVNEARRFHRLLSWEGCEIHASFFTFEVANKEILLGWAYGRLEDSDHVVLLEHWRYPFIVRPRWKCLIQPVLRPSSDDLAGFSYSISERFLFHSPAYIYAIDNGKINFDDQEWKEITFA